MPALRICGDPTVRDASASAGSSVASGSSINSSYVTPAPIVTVRAAGIDRPRPELGDTVDGDDDRCRGTRGDAAVALVDLDQGVGPAGEHHRAGVRGDGVDRLEQRERDDDRHQRATVQNVKTFDVVPSRSRRAAST